MTKKPLGDHLADYYATKQLRPSAVERLERMAETMELHPRRRRRTVHLSIAASVLGAILVALVLHGSSFSLPFSFRGTDLTREIAEEIVVNYEKNLRAEIVADDFGDLATMTDRLGFVPSEPARLAGGDLRLVGARFCSVQRRAAVQITLTDATYRRFMLYQLADAADLPDFEDAAVHVDDVQVALWREGAFVYGLVTPQE